MAEKGLNFIAIDFETANYNSNSACSIGLVRFVGGKEYDCISSLIRPPTNWFIQKWTDEIHHICWDDVCEEPYFDEVWNSTIVPFLNETPELPLVAHNAIFDMNVLRSCHEYYGMTLPKLTYFDSLQVTNL